MPENLGCLTEDKDEIATRDQSKLWKIKAIVARTTYRMFSKYGRESYVSKDNLAFSQ